MTLRSFLDAAQALVVEEHQRLGMSLPEALAEIEPWRAGGPRENQDGTIAQQRPRQSSAETTAAQNDQALQMLQMMMAGATKA